jgi:hypothetical protein
VAQGTLRFDYRWSMHYFTILSFSTLVLLATVLGAEQKVTMLKTTELLYNRLTDLYSAYFA